MPASERLRGQLAATIQACGASWGPETLPIILSDLAVYPEELIIRALGRCRRECKFKLTLADIVERIEDGRPSPNEAWAQVGTRDLGRTIVTTTEAMKAWGEIRLLLERDDVAARMAFLEIYRRIVVEAKEAGEPVRWTVSLGEDRAGRETALREAVSSGRLTAQEASEMLGGAPDMLTLNPAAARAARALPPHLSDASPPSEPVDHRPHIGAILDSLAQLEKRMRAGQAQEHIEWPEKMAKAGEFLAEHDAALAAERPRFGRRPA